MLVRSLPTAVLGGRVQRPKNGRQLFRPRNLLENYTVFIFAEWGRYIDDKLETSVPVQLNVAQGGNWTLDDVWIMEWSWYVKKQGGKRRED